MKMLFLSLCTLCCFQLMHAQLPNYSGTWKLANEKSEFGEAPFYIMAQVLTLRQTNDSIQLNGQYIDDKGSSSVSTATYALVGTPFERTWNENTKLVSSLTWSADKKTLVKNQQYTNPPSSQTPDRHVTEIWTLSENNTVFTIDQKVDITGYQGYSIKAVYIKN